VIASAAMMRRLATTTALVLLTACGGTPAPADAPVSATAAAGSLAPAAPSAPPAVDVWAGVLSGGATYTLSGGGGQTLVATAVDARALGKGRTVRLKWTIGGADHAGAPSQVAADAEAVHLLDASLEDADVVDALAAPSPWPRHSRSVPVQTRVDGLYAQVWRGADDVVVCYGEGPPPDAPPCEDVCFAEMCVSPRGGVVELGGTWAPNFETYTAAGYERFRETLTFVGSTAK
jgi:hypothetical protein